MAITSGILVVFGLLGYGISEYWFWSATPPTTELGALHLVERARASEGGTVGQVLTDYIAKLAQEKKIDQVDGWRVECQDTKCRVTYTIKLTGQDPQSAVWEVDIAAQTVSPQNGWAIDLTK
ncbi:MAG: hypothetical protein SNJ49_06535 [Chloracidobacterium sp.]